MKEHTTVMVDLYRDEDGCLRRIKNDQPYEIQTIPIPREAEDCLLIEVDVRLYGGYEYAGCTPTAMMLEERGTVIDGPLAEEVWDVNRDEYEECVLDSIAGCF